ncbi:ribbon-helix-helix protein, CopG family [Chitinibacter fontanus]|uniref:Ribbon-helix-helix protein, CopG family n=1 Tax=Chitinibacter fontanus TaxID=1737446 RepID=A0A7D5VC07_9NEIS|nr:ribbon-helix-helix protein, CopG family [Chitinibacter fontanus]QLI82660.1 ribbon-helix-helix protein, CopG family [Chitinibacter fontanus]
MKSVKKKESKVISFRVNAEMYMAIDKLAGKYSCRNKSDAMRRLLIEYMTEQGYLK